MEIKVYVTNISSGRSRPRGQWFSLPVSRSELVDKIGIDGTLEETIITDYESPFPISELANIDKLNALVVQFSELPDYIQKNVKVMLDHYFDGLEELIENWSDVSFIEEAGNDSDLGYYYCEDLEALTIPSALENYIDYDAIGRDFRINAHIIFVDGGALYK